VLAVEECLEKLRAAGALRAAGPGARGRLRVELSGLSKQRPFRGRKKGPRAYRLNFAALNRKGSRR